VFEEPDGFGESSFFGFELADLDWFKDPSCFSFKLEEESGAFDLEAGTTVRSLCSECKQGFVRPQGTTGRSTFSGGVTNQTETLAGWCCSTCPSIGSFRHAIYIIDIIDDRSEKSYTWTPFHDLSHTTIVYVFDIVSRTVLSDSEAQSLSEIDVSFWKSQ
jgi:hypothetical protein